MTEPNAFTGAELDRAGDGRRTDPAWVEARRSDPRARVLIGGDAGLRGGAVSLLRVPLADLGDEPEAVLLGDDDEGPLWVIDADPPPRAKRPRLVGAAGPRDISPGDGPEGWLGIREAAAALPAAESGLAAYAVALLNWHRAHRYCANCGAATELAEGGMVRACPRCRTQHHPRTDPVVIMLVVGPEGALLGRRGNWPELRYSALAGFVSPGESLEEAVAREVLEEAGVEIEPPAYVSSQPWPFPASLMLGFIAPWRAGEIGGSDPELEDVRWFSREEVAEAARHEDDWTSDAPSDGLQLPPRTAIARRLVEEWLERAADPA
ncbi:MAG: NAD(+) diphosphatase [Solirubrobacterales bacterium]|nr:NAD(+) diphosphatase [Thermoleophilales bacterium]MCO5327886.1 NAD(+) diphosphatase [Solirubrobacterales bacterium]